MSDQRLNLRNRHRHARWPSPLRMVSAFLDHGSLTWEMSKRDVLGRYRGATFGLLWTLVSPFIMLIVYSVAFGHLMRARWPQIGDDTTSYTLILYAGLIVHGFFSECLMRSPTLVVSNPNYVKRVIFPIEILPWPMVLSALFHTAMNIVVFALFSFYIQGSVPWTIFLVPIVFAPLAVLTLGMSWAMASLGVYFRDIGQVTAPLATAMLFLSSAIMPLSVVPPKFQILFRINPLTFIIDQTRAVILWGHSPDWSGLGLYMIASLVFAYGAYLWFHATQKGFADVI